VTDDDDDDDNDDDDDEKNFKRRLPRFCALPSLLTQLDCFFEL